ncbi:MAG: hypothetical protein RR840_11310 [Clostridium sp.]
MGCSHTSQDNEYSSLIRSLISCVVKVSSQLQSYNNIYENSENQLIKSIVDTKKTHLNGLLHMYKLAKGEDMKYSTNEDNTILDINSLIIDEFKLIDNLKLLSTLLPYQNLIQASQLIIVDINTIVNKLLYLKK